MVHTLGSRFDNKLEHHKLDPRRIRNEHLRQDTLCILYSATTGDLTSLKR